VKVEQTAQPSSISNSDPSTRRSDNPYLHLPLAFYPHPTAVADFH
jgi:hypothetical protein